MDKKTKPQFMVGCKEKYSENNHHMSFLSTNVSDGIFDGLW